MMCLINVFCQDPTIVSQVFTHYTILWFDWYYYCDMFYFILHVTYKHNLSSVLMMVVQTLTIMLWFIWNSCYIVTTSYCNSMWTQYYMLHVTCYMLHTNTVLSLYFNSIDDLINRVVQVWSGICVMFTIFYCYLTIV